MPDREKVIDALEHCELCACNNCPYNENGKGGWNCRQMHKDAIDLLKEQETEDTGRCRIFQCKKCGFGIDDIFVNDEGKYQIRPGYCPNCGRSVKWG